MSSTNKLELETFAGRYNTSLEGPSSKGRTSIIVQQMKAEMLVTFQIDRILVLGALEEILQ